MIRSVLRDDRGLALGIMAFFAMLIVGAMLYILLDPALAAVTDATASQAESEQAKQIAEQRYRMWGYAMMAVVAIAGIMLVARAFVEGGGP